MLVCPQCQFENPDTNKFCQQCGASLTHKYCPECGTQVAYSAKNCPNCNALTGSLWLAIVSTQADPTTVEPANSGQSENAIEVKNITSDLSPTTESADPLVASQTEVGEIQVWWDSEKAEENLAGSGSSDRNPLPALGSIPEAYLDQNQRYQLLEELKPTGTAESQARVLDCQPLQPSPVEIVVAGQIKAPVIENPEEPTTAVSDLFWQTLPAIAKVYSNLEPKLYPALPRIHDAWCDRDRQVVLIADRSGWPLLVELWRDDEIPLIQLLHLLHEILSLWVALEPYNCCSSLLNINNLRVDEDQSLGLLRLYRDPPTEQPTLSALGQMWHQLYMESGRTLVGPIASLMSDIKADTVSSIDELHERLQTIAQELQSEPTHEPISISIPPVDPEIDLGLSPQTFRLPAKDRSLHYPGNSPGDENETPTIVLPMQLLSLEDSGRTDVGRQRRHNEDYFGVQTSLIKMESPLGRTIQARGLYILCDGMGGHAGGEVASALAVKTLSQFFQEHWQEELPDEDCIRQSVFQANQAIYDINQQDARSGSGRMGTTLVMVLVQETQVAVAHVGDSRLYKINRRGIEQITMDHEVGQREIKRGVERAIAYNRPDAYQLTQALGPRNEHFVDPDITFIELNEDTLLLLCSDGLSDNDLVENHWQTHLQPLLASRANLEQGVTELIELANQYNGHDNITAVLIRAKVRPDLDQARLVV